MMVANVCNYLFQIIMGRMMLPADYGTLNTLLSVFTVFSVSSSLFASVAAQETAYYRTLGQDDHIRLVIRKLLRLAVLLSHAILVVGTALSSWVASLLQIEDRLLVSLTMLLVAVGGICPLFSGLLQGLNALSLSASQGYFPRWPSSCSAFSLCGLAGAPTACLRRCLSAAAPHCFSACTTAAISVYQGHIMVLKRHSNSVLFIGILAAFWLFSC